MYGYLLGRSYDPESLPALARQYEAFKKNETGEIPDVPFLKLTALELSNAAWRKIAERASWQTTRMNLNTFARHGVFGDARIVELRLERQIGGGGDTAGGIRDHQGQAERPHLLSQPKQGFRFGPRSRVIQAAEDSGIQPAGGGRVSLEVTKDEKPRAEAQCGQQSHQRHYDGGREALKPVAKHVGSSGRRRGTVLGRRALPPIHRPLGCSPVAR